MLLTCCFRESKSERRARETEERVTSTLDVRQLQPQVDTVRPVDGCQVLPGVHEVHRVPPDRRDCKERAPLRKDEKRLYKQKSQESLGNKTTTASPPPYPTTSGGNGGGRQVRISSSIPYIDQSPTAPIAQAPSVTDTLKDASGGEATTSPRNGSYCQPPPPAAAARGSARSTPNLPTATPTHTTGRGSALNMPRVGRTPPPAPPPLMVRTTTRLSTSSVVTPSQQAMVASSTSSSSCTSPERGAAVSAEDRAVLSRGITRSNASYGIQQMLQEQIILEEREQQKIREQQDLQSVYEEKISVIKEEHQLALQQLTREKQTEVINAKNRFETDLKTQAEETRRVMEEMRAAHKEQMGRMQSEMEAQMHAMRREHSKVVDNYEARDQAWQLEKEDVLSEIQRLKQEAKRFIAILSQESDDEALSPTKRQSLTREVESLQLVVEMRTNELHQLREERDRHIQQLEDFDNLKSNLGKMSARVEDLQAQLEEKTKLERQLSRERHQLANSVEVESKTKARMSMQVEELQWRIKNNLELPPTQVFSPEKEAPILFFGTSTTQQQPPDADDTINNKSLHSPNNNSTQLDLTENNNKNHNKKRNSPAKVAAKMVAAANAAAVAAAAAAAAAGASPPEPSLQRPTNLDLLHTNQPEVRLEDDGLNGNGPVAVAADEEEELVIVREAQSGDEGISSEASNSPAPPPNGDMNGSSSPDNNNQVENNNCDNNKSFFEDDAGGGDKRQRQQQPSTPSPPQRLKPMNSDKSPVSPLMSSPCDDRVPSRIPLSVSGKGKN